MTIANIIGGILFGGIGFVALVYGKKQGNLKAMIFGALLLIYPYFVTDSILLYSIGIVLTIILLFFR